MTYENVLAIETSCDDTSIAVVNSQGRVLSMVTANQDLAHKDFGGVVPEIAGRNHIQNILPLVSMALKGANFTWDDVQGLAVTNRPGLVGSLIVGLVTAKSLALALDKPFIGVNHIEGHIWAPFLSDESYTPRFPGFPFLSLAISGGHTRLFLVEGLGKYKVLGSTIDDAAGECFDKFGKMMGLGYPGGVKVDGEGKKGQANKFRFPRPLLKEDNYNFSFSGLKTAALRLLESMSKEEMLSQRPDLCASFQEAIVDVLVARLFKAANEFGISNISVTGGVSANSRLRQVLEDKSKLMGCSLFVPPLQYCTDNAGMIGYAGIQRFNNGESSSAGLGPSPKSYPEDFESATP